MNNLITLSLLIIVACNLGVLWLFIRLHRSRHQLDNLTHLVLHRLAEAATRQRGIKQALLEDGKLTRQRISQIKTRLADEERQNQKDLAHARYLRQKEGN